MTQIAQCDWLPERARWRARSGLPAVSRKKNFLENHIINPLLTKFVRSRWLDIGLILFSEFMFVSVHKHAKKELGQYPAILTSHLVNSPYILYCIVYSARESKSPAVSKNRKICAKLFLIGFVWEMEAPW